MNTEMLYELQNVKCNKKYIYQQSYFEI